MSKGRPAASGYARIAQAEEEEELLDDSEDDDPYVGTSSIAGGTRYAPIQPTRQGRMQMSAGSSPRRGGRRHRSNSGVDIKAINARLERWADEIASKFKIRRFKGKTEEEEQLEIHHSVFQAPDWIRPATAEALAAEYGDDAQRMTKMEFDDIVESVRVAIEMQVHPTLISQGSSGSYFARNRGGKVVGVFKPKDEEPYASRNPKWTKWIHRNLFPFFFGRACLIPNLSYVSEAAAYVLDTQLRTNLVPYTDVVSLSSKSFYYDFWDRRAFYRKKKPLPEKLGSFQIFLKGYRDANLFLKEHPWPDQHGSGFRAEAAPRRKKRRWAEDCRPRGAPSDDEDEETGDLSSAAEDSQRRGVFWTESLQQSFREQLEKLVVLDYIMRNTDRGLDNWMIRIDEATEKASIVAEPPKPNGHGNGQPSVDRGRAMGPDGNPYKREEPMRATSRSATPPHAAPDLSVSIGAIDNSLSWPWKHPDAWRSYPFGWLFLPVTLVGQPFSEATRQHFLPLLTSKRWWSETQLALRKCFAQDADFKERMFAKQMAVMKGQAWNVVETLKTPDHGPLELTRRTRVCVWDDIVEVPIAVPLRMPSAEMRRRQEEERARAEQDEADIGAAHASAPAPQHDLLGLNSPLQDLAQNNRFNLPRQSSSRDVRSSDESSVRPLSPPSIQAIAGSSHSRREKTSDPGYFAARPGPKPRVSYEEPRRFRPQSDRRRRFSFGSRQHGTPLLGEDDIEGDLGYAAVEDMDYNRKKVIVERLEMVKGKNPFFTWC